MRRQSFKVILHNVNYGYQDYSPLLLTFTTFPGRPWVWVQGKMTGIIRHGQPQWLWGRLVWSLKNLARYYDNLCRCLREPRGYVAYLESEVVCGDKVLHFEANCTDSRRQPTPTLYLVFRERGFKGAVTPELGFHCPAKDVEMLRDCLRSALRHALLGELQLA